MKMLRRMSGNATNNRQKNKNQKQKQKQNALGEERSDTNQEKHYEAEHLRCLVICK